MTDKKGSEAGWLSNRQVEEDLKVSGAPHQDGSHYTGSQDTGEDIVRDMGSPVQQADGRPPEQNKDEAKNKESR